jgi:hypothetical protein
MEAKRKMTEATTPTPTTLTMTLPSAAELAKRGNSALELVASFVVDSKETYELAAEELQAIQKREKTLNDQRMSITRPIDEAKTNVMSLFRPATDALAQAGAILKTKMLGYAQEQQRKAAAERAESERLAQEERSRLEAQAAALAAEGRAGEAEVKHQIAAMIVAAPPATETTAPKVAGISTRSVVDFELVDLLALVQHVALNPELVGLLQIDSVKVRAHVKSLGLACKTPGLRVFDKASIAASRK